jgi:hypothetical protein
VSIAENIWTEALFCSDVLPADNPSPDQVRAAVDHQIWAVGIAECVARVAFECGEYPSIATARMAWCRAAVQQAYAAPARVLTTA